MEMKNQKLLLIITILAAVCLVSNSMEEKRLLKRDDGSLKFLVVGDWGRRGLYNQSLVSSQMGKIGKKLHIDFVISTGDNFYEDGLTGSDDPAFLESFSNIYTSSSLQVPWFTVLGNHDYRGDVEAQLSLALKQKDKRWLCCRSFFVNGGIVDLFFVDTTPFVNEYFVDPGHHTYDWSGVLPRENYLSTILENLSSALKKSTASWKIVVGHHTIKSAGQHGVTQELATQLEPILEKYNVDFYLNGHDHCLEHITSSQSNTQYVTSGGGSKAWRGVVREWDPEELQFYYDGQGFLSVEVNSSVANLAFYDVFGNVLHQWNVSKQALRHIMGEE